MPAPVFIPKAEIVPGVDYRGYVAVPGGLLHHSKARTKGHLHDKTLTWNEYSDTKHIDWGVEPAKKRTPAERLESLTKRLIDHFQMYGWSESLEEELLKLSWEAGKPVSRERLREMARHRLGPDGKAIDNEVLRHLAAAKLTEAEKEWEREQGKHVVRKSPHVLDPGPGQQGAVSGHQGG